MPCLHQIKEVLTLLNPEIKLKSELIELIRREVDKIILEYLKPEELRTYIDGIIKNIEQDFQHKLTTQLETRIEQRVQEEIINRINRLK